MNEYERIERLESYRNNELNMIAVLAVEDAFDKKLSNNVSKKFNVNHKIERGDRIERLANKYKVTVEEIVERNSLEYPYIDTTKTKQDRVEHHNPSILFVGETLLIPVDIQEGLKKKTTLANDQYSYFGNDFLVKRDKSSDLYDLVVNDDDSDFKFVSGPEQVEQNCYIMLDTPAGRFIDFPMYGNALKNGNKMDIFTINFDRMRLKTAIEIFKMLTAVEVYQISVLQGVVNYYWKAKIRNIEREISGKARKL